MFRINSQDNAISRLESRSFGELGFRERAHLQEWIAKYPACLGEDLLIIQKEFAGFSDTQERLDLLALDKDGRLVIIENKLDDTGRDVTWQAMKYASYCAGLKTESIRSIFQDYLRRERRDGVASEIIAEFLGVDDLNDVALNKGFSQRIILIAANFRKEVTSTVLWLMNFNLQIQCFRVTPWSHGDDLFLNIEQIIPTPDAQEFVIGLVDKARDEAKAFTAEAVRHALRREFWGELIEVMNHKSSLYSNISPGVANWIGAGSGMRGVSMNFSVSGKYSRAEVYIDRGSLPENEVIFDRLLAEKDQIEAEFGGLLIWDRLDGKRACRIKAEESGDIFDREVWPQMIEFMTDAMVRLDKSVRPRLATASRELPKQAIT